MNVRGLAVAIFCAAVPFTLSCAQSDEFDTAGSATPGQSSTGGAATVGLGGLGGGVNATGGRSGGIAGDPMVAGGSAGHAGMVPSPEGTGGSVTTGGETGGASSSTATGASGGATGSTTTASGGRTGNPGNRMTGGSTGNAGSVTGGQTGSTGGTNGGTGGTTAATGGSTAATGGSMGAMGGSMGATGGRAGVTGGSTGATGGSSGITAGGTIVPLYTDPTDRSWTTIITAALAHPTVEVVAIVNPADGPGSSKSADYTTGIASLQGAHIKVIGYVATGYGSNSIASVEADIDRWKSLYPTVQGIFFDEQSNNPADVAHYQTLSQYAKSKGLSYTVGNPGTDVPTSYIGVLDTMMVYETDGLPSIASLKAWSAYAPSNFGIIPYKCPMDAAFVKQARQYVRYIYLQSDDLPNPWDSLTTFFSDLLAALE